jgi:hypothetical protein
MRKTISKRDKHVKRNVSGWDKAIVGLEKRLSRLKAILAHAREMKATNEPWPGDSAT